MGYKFVMTPQTHRYTMFTSCALHIKAILRKKIVTVRLHVHVDSNWDRVKNKIRSYSFIH